MKEWAGVRGKTRNGKAPRDWQSSTTLQLKEWGRGRNRVIRGRGLWRKGHPMSC